MGGKLDCPTSNIVVEWLTLLFHIQEVPGSNLVPETDYSEGIFVFFSVPPGRCRDSTLNQAMTASFQSLTNSSLPYHHLFDAT
jgi:hypothetical protein